MTLDLDAPPLRRPRDHARRLHGRAEHPMIGPLWRGRMRMGDVIIPLAPARPVFIAFSTAMRLHHGLRESFGPSFAFFRSIKD